MKNWQQWDYANALNTIDEMVNLMQEEGMEESDTLGEAYTNAAEYAMSLGWWAQARDWAGKTLKIEEKCCGSQSPEYEKALVLLQSAKEGA